MKNYLEIRKTKNGYIIFDEEYPSNHFRSLTNAQVFETLDSALNFIRDSFSPENKVEGTSVKQGYEK